MTDQDSVEARKAASAVGAGDNSEVGVDGDDASAADRRAGGDTPDPVTGTTGHAVGQDQAEENRDREPAG